MCRHRALLLLGAVTALILSPSHITRAQTDEAEWHSVASGDEILALALAPGDPNTLWAGTEGGGLLRWNLTDGRFVQSLFPDQPGLAGNQVRDIAFAADGTAWLAIPGGGVTRVAGEAWRRYRSEDGLPAGLDLTSIAITGDGSVWVGTRTEGLARLAPGEDEWTVVTVNETEPSTGPGAPAVADMAVSPDGGELWVAHGRAHTGELPALSVLDVSSGEWRTVQAAAPGADAGEPGTGDELPPPPAEQIMALAFAEDGTLWLGTWAKGVLSFDGGTWRQHLPADGLCSRNVWAVLPTGGEVWVACGQDRPGASDRGAGVAVWDGSAWTSLSAADGLPTEDVVALAAGGGRVYLGTNPTEGTGSGIVPLSERRPGPALRTFPATPPTNDITAIAFEPNGEMWVGTRGAGLLHHDGRTWRQFTREATPGLTGDTVTALLVAGDRLYVGTAKTVVEGRVYVDGGLTIHDLAADTWRAIRAEAGGLPDNDVSSLALADDGRLWVGLGVAQDAPGSGASAQRGDGLAVFDPANETWSTINRGSSQGGLVGDTVTGLALAGPALWAATSYAADSTGSRVGGGVSRLLDGAWQAWPGGEAGLNTYSDPDGVTGDLRSILVDREGQTWAGTWNLGNPVELSGRWPRVNAVINHWDGQAWQPETFAEAGWVSALAEDGVAGGRPWAATTRGHVTEFSPGGNTWLDAPPGGAFVHTGVVWENFTPQNSGLGSYSLTSLAVEPSTGHLWLGSESAGLSEYRAGSPLAAPTPCGECPGPLPAALYSDTPAAPASDQAAGIALVAVLLALALGLAVWIARRRSGTVG